MPEVETTDGVESPAAEVEPTEVEATPDAESLTTLKARLAGKDRAYTTLKAEAEQTKALVTELSRWKAEKEAADMTEVERYQAQIAALEAEKQAAVNAAKALQLAKDFPLAHDFLGDDLATLSEAKLAEIEERLKAKSEPAEPTIDPNNPRRTVPPGTKALKDKSKDELLADLLTFANPFSPDVIAAGQ